MKMFFRGTTIVISGVVIVTAFILVILESFGVKSISEADLPLQLALTGNLVVALPSFFLALME